MAGVFKIVENGVERYVDLDGLNKEHEEWDKRGIKVENDPDNPGGLRTETGVTVTPVSGGT